MARYGCGECLIEFETKEDIDKHNKEKHPDAVEFIHFRSTMESQQTKILHDMLYGDKKKKERK